MQLGSHVAVALVWAGGYSSDSTPNLGTPSAVGAALKKTKRQKNKKDNVEFLKIGITK